MPRPPIQPQPREASLRDAIRNPVTQLGLSAGFLAASAAAFAHFCLGC